MPLIRNKPQGPDLLSDSQPILLNNNNAIDDSFGNDHYAASDLTVNNGRHRILTTVTQTVHPTTTDNCIFYGMQDNPTTGALQYSKGPTDVVQTPMSCLQSSSAGINLGSNGTSNILDFSAVQYSHGTVIASGLLSGVAFQLFGTFFWKGSASALYSPIVLALNIALIEFSGNVLRIRAASSALTSISWTLEFNRIFTPL